MGALSRILKQAATLAAPAKQTLASTKAILAKNTLVVGDDMAVKTERSLGIKPEREGHALWQSTKGALKNRAIIWPVGIGISVAFPALMAPALLIGAGYLCYEVAHVLHGAMHKGDGHEHEGEGHGPEGELTEEDYAAFEKQKIDSFIRTDFVMAMETTAIGLGEVAHLPLLTRALSFGVAGIALLAGVSTAVFGLLKIDDVGHHFANKQGDGIFAKAQRGVGRGILHAAPGLMKGLAVVGVGAMLLVGGGMLVHTMPAIPALGIPALHTLSHSFAHLAHGVPMIGGVLEAAAPIAFNAVAGLTAGFGILAAKGPVGAVYNKTLKPVVDFVKEQGSKVAGVFSRKKGNEPEMAPDVKTEEPAVAETVDVREQHAMDIEEPAITTPTISAAEEMAKVANVTQTPDSVTNDNVNGADQDIATDDNAPKANLV